MDFSKLPKLSESPAPPPAATGDATPGDQPQRVVHYAPAPPANAWDFGFEVFLALLLGVIFLFLGMNFGRWSIAKLSGQPFNTGVGWAAGNDRGIPAGTPVEYFDLEGGTAWGEMGFFVLGVALLLEAAVLALAMRRGAPGNGVFGICLLLGVIGLVANIVAAVMVVRAGITMPLFSIVAAFVGVFTVFIHARHIFERPATTIPAAR